LLQSPAATKTSQINKRFWRGGDRHGDVRINSANTCLIWLRVDLGVPWRDENAGRN
jgi:hypothetical protein